MDVITACLLLKKSNKDLNVDNVESLFKAIGGNFDRDAVEYFFSQTGERSFDEIEEEGSRVISEMAISAAQSQPQQAEKVEEKAPEEPKKEEVYEEVNLFGDDDDFF